MPELIAHTYKNGFWINAVCPHCGYPIKMWYHWNSFATVGKPYDKAYGICPGCKKSFTISLSNVTKPFKNCSYLLIKQY